jgi:transketolase
LTKSFLRDVFGDYLVSNGTNHYKIVVLDADLSSSTRTYKFAKKFPNRFFNVGIAEQNMLGVAIGLAISGKVPVVSGFSIFTTGRAWEFIRLACHDNLNLKLITTHSGFVGEDGFTHNALEDIALMAILPNMRVLVPIDDFELKKMLDFVFNTKGPFYVRLPRESFPKIHNKDYNFSIGKPEVLKQGNDICLIGTGYGSILAKESAIKLEQELNLSVKVINLSTVKPIDEKELLNVMKNIKGIVILEEHNYYCGFGSIISRIISNTNPLPIKVIGVENSYGESGTRALVLKHNNLNYSNLKTKIQELKNFL